MTADGRSVCVCLCVSVRVNKRNRVGLLATVYRGVPKSWSRWIGTKEIIKPVHSACVSSL